MRITVGSLQLSRYTPADRRALYRIRNHPSVRQRLPNSDPVPYRSHVAWTREHLGDGSDHLLFLVRWKGEAEGFALLRRVANGTVEIGVMFREADRWPLQISQAAARTMQPWIGRAAAKNGDVTLGPSLIPLCVLMG